MKTKFIPDAIVADSTLGPRQIKVVANSGEPDRVGDILVASGCKLDNYKKNPIVLSGHDTSKAVGTAHVYVAGSRVEAIITFAPAGASREADETCALAKSGVFSAVSVGFRPISSEPIRGGGGERYTAWELCELSVVAVPCDPGALVIARSLHSKSGRVLNGRNAASLAALAKCLEKSGAAHCDALDLLDKADGHRARAIRHAATIAASQSDDGPGDDYEDPTDDPEDDDNVELALEAERRKRQRQIQILGLTHCAADAPEPALDMSPEQRRAALADLDRSDGFAPASTLDFLSARQLVEAEAVQRLRAFWGF
jgi:HK97 family phage prohead protease